MSIERQYEIAGTQVPTMEEWLSRYAHTGQTYGDTDPYFETHIMGVQRILAERGYAGEGLDLLEQTILLHDAVEDDPRMSIPLFAVLGVHPLVRDGVDRLTDRWDYSKSYAENARIKTERVLENPLSRLVKLGDGLFNLERCEVTLVEADARIAAGESEEAIFADLRIPDIGGRSELVRYMGAIRERNARLEEGIMSPDELREYIALRR